jgi:predicted anti-sigma-YlaC factor YlaD
MNCSEVSDYLITHDDGVSLDLPSVVVQHLDTCARCRLEFEQNRNLAADLRWLAEHEVEVPAWLQGTLTEITVEKLRRKEALRVASRQLAKPRVLGGALLLAGVAGLVVRGRIRRRLSEAPAAA